MITFNRRLHLKIFKTSLTDRMPNGTASVRRTYTKTMVQCITPETTQSTTTIYNLRDVANISEAVQTLKYRWKLYAFCNSIPSLADHAISAHLSAVLYKKIPFLYSNNGDNSLAQRRTRHATNFLFSVHFDKYSEICAGVPTSKNVTASL